MKEPRSVRSGLMVVSLCLSVGIGLVVSRGRGGDSGSARDAQGGTKRRVLIGLSLDTLKEARWQRDRDEFVARAHALGADVLVQSANSDDARQLADVEALVSQHVSVLVLVPHDGTAMAKAVRIAHDAGIPVLAYDRIVRDADLDLYISFDNVAVGELQARYLAEHLPSGTPPHEGRKLRIVRVYGSKADNNALLFKAGQDKVILPLVRSGSVVVVHEDWADEWKPESAKKIVNAALSKHAEGIDAVLASNDGTAGGAIQALTEEGLAGKVLVTGQDADLVACQRIAQGTQHMTIYKPLRALTARAAEAAMKLATGGVVVAKGTVSNGKIDVPSILFGVVTVTRDNLESTVVGDGFHRHEDVFGGVR